MLKIIISILILFSSSSLAYSMINLDYLKNSPELCPVQYSTEKNNLIYQYYDIYAES
jgi:hypothetical protein